MSCCTELKKEIDSKIKEKGVSTGIKFVATDNYNRKINYTYEGYGDLSNICFSIHLKNLNDGTDTYVEPKWFDNRIIEVL